MQHRSERHKNGRSYGRPPGGHRGERVRDYPTLTVRVPQQTRLMLKALAAHRREPLWKLIRHLTICGIRDLPARERRQLMRRLKRMGSR